MIFTAILMSLFVQNIEAQSTQLAGNDNNISIELLGGIGERTISGAEIISSLQEGVAITRLYDRYGLVNAQGVEIVSPRFEEIHLFQNGYAAAKMHGKWSFINKQGKKLTAFQYDWVGHFQEGLAPVKMHGKWGFINEQGAEICKTEFDAVSGFEQGKALVRKGNKWYYLNIKGELTLVEGTAQQAQYMEI